jgi:FtsX-like permease family
MANAGLENFSRAAFEASLRKDYPAENVRDYQRTHEIGIRMALGAGKRQVLASILLETLILTVLGIVAGLPITFKILTEIKNSRPPE